MEGGTEVLARKYDYYEAWEEERVFSKNKRKIAVENKKEASTTNARTVFVVVAVGIACYLCGVVLGSTYFRGCNALVALKIQEEDLLAKNEALQIDVDKLRNPARITDIASRQLGMSTARNNIYVQADSNKIAYDGYAYAKK